MSDVQLVIVLAEPGDPRGGESYGGDTISGVIANSVAALRGSSRPIHRNVRRIMEVCFPEASFEERLQRTWRTNAVLCSAAVKCGPVPRIIEDRCVDGYLLPQLRLLPNAVIAALGGKAQARLDRHNVKFIPALHPSNRESREANEASWKAIAEEIHKRFPMHRQDSDGQT